MSAPKPRTRCPYTLMPLQDLKARSREHVIPDALGGPDAYSVEADRQINSDLGTELDGKLVSSTLVAAQRVLHGVKCRSGEPAWKVVGTLPNGTQVDLQVTPTETFQRVVNPVNIDPDKKAGSITVSAEHQEAFLKEFIEGHRRKGKDVVVGKETSLGRPELRVNVAMDMLVLKRAMLKIAYLATFEYLGDAFLDDPLIPEWHRALFAKSDEDVKSARIHGVAFDAGVALDLLFPQIQPHEHAITIANLQQKGPVVGVTLFGRAFHNLMVVASESSNFGLRPAEGQVLICDAKARTVRRMSFEDHLKTAAPALPLDWESLDK